MHRKGVGQHKKSCKRTKGGVLASAITLDDLRPVFVRSAVEAAGRLGVGLTVLKRRCRELGVSRWPYRQITCIEKLIDYLKREGDVEDGELKEKLRQLRYHKEVILNGRLMELPPWAKRSQQHLSKMNYRARMHQRDHGCEVHGEHSDTGQTQLGTQTSFDIDATRQGSSTVPSESPEDEMPSIETQPVSDLDMIDVDSDRANSESCLSELGCWLPLEKAMMCILSDTNELPSIALLIVIMESRDSDPVEPPATESSFIQGVYMESVQQAQERHDFNFHPCRPYYHDGLFHDMLSPPRAHYHTPLTNQSTDEISNKVSAVRQIEDFAQQLGYCIDGDLDIRSIHPDAGH